MHQYQQQQRSRPPPFTVSSANSEQTNPTKTNNQRDNTPSAQASGSSEDFVPDTAASMQRLNQVIQNFHTKAALIILHSRAELSPAYSSRTNERRVNKWFNIELDETDDYLEDIKTWKRIDVQQERPSPLMIEVYLTTDPLPQGQRLVILDDEQKRWDVYNALEPRDARSTVRTERSREILLERWTIELGQTSQPIPADLVAILPHVYKKSIVLFRALYTYCNFLPAWKLIRKLGRSRSTMGMKVGYRIVDGDRLDSIARADNLNTPLYDTSSDVVTEYSFGSTESPAGPFSVQVKYRSNCDFRVDDTEELLSSRLIGFDNQPVSRRETGAQKVGSLPNDQRRHLMERPELGHAYGSLSTYHQAGVEPGTSPMSALRAQKDYGSDSPSPQRQPSQPLQPQRTVSSRPAPAAPRRSSFSIQPFKAPTLAASPLGSSPLAASPRVSTRAVPTLGSLEEEVLPGQSQQSSRQLSEAASVSSSPRPAPVQRFQSSFSHRPKRPSVDRTTNKTDEDQSSSGKASATSSTQPGSGLMVDPTADGSSGSMQADDENISDFLKMLDQKKDLLSPTSPTAVESSARRTTAALNKFHKMRDSNAALSESMSSSLVVPRPSPSNRQTHPTAGSNSSSPGGKPVSPHAPHTPFAPSRLSAAYSHDDHEIEESASPVEEVPETASGEAPGAINIPNSPRLFTPGYRRSSSAQRRPLPSDDDIGDLYGMKSASMGSKLKNESGLPEDPRQLHQATGRRETKDSLAAGQDETVSDSGSARSSLPNASRSRYTSLRAGTRDRGDSHTSPTRGSLSSVSGTGASVERDRHTGADSGSSANASFGRAGRMKPMTPRPDTKTGGEDDEDLAFLFPMDQSTMQGTEKKKD